MMLKRMLMLAYVNEECSPGWSLPVFECCLFRMRSTSATTAEKRKWSRPEIRKPSPSISSTRKLCLNKCLDRLGKIKISFMMLCKIKGNSRGRESSLPYNQISYLMITF